MGISLKNKIVFITGASSGIGEACAKVFAEHGAKLLLCARRFERLEALSAQLKQLYDTHCHLLALDICDRHAVEHAVQSLPHDWKNVAVLVNNAGLAAGLIPLQDGSIEDWETMIDTNIKGLLYMTRALIPTMIQQNEGHILNIGSVAGHEVYPMGNVYSATKHAVFALTKSLKIDLLGTKIRISSIDPGLVETEFSLVRFKGDKVRAKKIYAGMHPLTPEDIADAVFYCASRPLHVNVLDMIILPTAQASPMLVHRIEE